MARMTSALPLPAPVAAGPPAERIGKPGARRGADGPGRRARRGSGGKPAVPPASPTPPRRRKADGPVPPGLQYLLGSFVFPSPMPPLRDAFAVPGVVTVLKRRWLYHDTAPLDMHSFSVLSWNVLAPTYERLAPSPPGYPARRNRIASEILYYEPDILCLQEVDPDDFAAFFLPLFSAAGYDGHYAAKSAHDGCALFYRRDRLALAAPPTVLRYRDVPLDGPPLDAPAQWVGARPADAVTRHASFANIAQIAVLRNAHTGAKVRVVNTHLLWQPEFADAKLLQAAILVEHLVATEPRPGAAGHAGAVGAPACPAAAAAGPAAQTPPIPIPVPPCPAAKAHAFYPSPESPEGRAGLAPAGRGAHRRAAASPAQRGSRAAHAPPSPPSPPLPLPPTPTILCGDLNSLPDSSVLQLLLTGSVPTSEFDGSQFGRFTSGAAFAHSLRLRSAYEGSSLPYTHRVPHFGGTIDHMLYSAGQLKLLGILDTSDPPGHLDAVASLPTPHVPSDHLPLLSIFRSVGASRW